VLLQRVREREEISTKQRRSSEKEFMIMHMMKEILVRIIVETCWLVLKCGLLQVKRFEQGFIEAIGKTSALTTSPRWNIEQTLWTVAHLSSAN
jgi:hypothetical protein